MADGIVLKTCPGCQQERPLIDYSRDRSKPDGLSHFCRSCRSSRHSKPKDDMGKYCRDHRRTPHGRAVMLWHAMNQRVKASGPKNACYAGISVLISRLEFHAWIEPLLDEWFRDRPNDVPSVDRINPEKNYEIGNLRLLELGENARQSRANINKDAPEGTWWCPKCERFAKVEEFYKKPPTKLRPNGLSGYCAPCMRKWSSERNSDRSRGHVFRLSRCAHAAVFRAVKKGILIRPEKCSHPGCEKTKVHAHHHLGYAAENRLNVIWLCHSHHALAEGR